MASDNSTFGTLSSSPQAGQIILYEDREYETVKEGLAYILVPRVSTSPPENEPKNKPTEDKNRPAVFYNPIQQFNRDLSVLAIRAYGEHAVATKLEHRERVVRRWDQSKCKGKKRKREAVGRDNTAASSGQLNKKQYINEAPEVSISEEASVVAKPDTSERFEEGKREWRPPFKILDALSATGLRALRYAKELPFVTQVIANDLSAAAINSMKANIQHNSVEKIVQPNKGDACAYMYSVLGPQKMDENGSFFGKFDVVDLDPYGTAAPFMDAAVQAVADGGMLCVTCTDAGVFAAVGYPEKAFALYGGIPIKGVHCHEGGIRLILHALAMSAAKYGIAIEPLLSLSIDFYARLFVRVHKSPSATKFTASKSMMVYGCDSGCGAWTTQRLAQSRKREGKNGAYFYTHRLSQAPSAAPHCEHCGFKTHIAGPMWGGPLHNPHFIQRILDLLAGADRDTYPTFGRIEGMLTTALEEDLTLESSRDPTPESDSVSVKNNNYVNGKDSLLIPRVDPDKLEPYPFFFMTSALSKVLHTQTMPENSFRGALRHLGYKSTRSHAKPGSIRTDAPWSVVWEIMREWVRQKSPVKAGAITEGSAGFGIMGRGGRENPDADGAGAGLRSLKLDILGAVDSGRNLADLTMKIEAALYRASAKRPAESNAAEKSPADCNLTPRNKSEESSLSKQPALSNLDIVFDEALGKKAIDAQRRKRLIRYQINPRPNWGPQARAPVINTKKD
ncbi:RNA methyltransferase tRNA(m5U54)methyltransferase [Ophidiomyces ophidiicola]|uniref:RNA methyltransferase tRNA(M5U54)methyltransferase n=1 Tax=Ophidiomyces ophidiicola TaxID=1387563 RepID=A0ACB8UY55_9EURO|nr:RNA methyltransferase tRNA(m5U54)methyltransferase [Ophidiomyces ophidiicola]KAI1945745.1 RNA methyltransferase tRNA(m5U54)methyltransferase [Ophidiomyces ophidiicola]KAI1950663.1 RNA methyltransferase tRNA(m5U54)methyltransferase [Ophidiomyces ophidiicola]KAI1972626.1 RNA methyltransferase tRNA(m5U54)methyltransferase [Ophidiomyces ophidiicola]KAI2006623.1 RNA methyltransferase tRNA(m5U54)methyltransferase [Ophidiomyces ophidiicola]KAI2018334.1 RNA methyltransferase tRNA(m5U54)methyltransf